MRIKKNCSVFWQLIMPDGLEIVSRTKAGEEILVRTIIHPDSLITHVAEKALETPDICKIHFKSISDEFKNLEEFRKYLNCIIAGIQIAIFVISCFLCWQGVVKHYTFLLIIAFVFSVLSLMIKIVLRLIIKYYIKRKIKFNIP